MSKRTAKVKRPKPTYKNIGGVKVQTNPKFTTDAETPWPSALIEKKWKFGEHVGVLVQFAFVCGLKIGRARATASGKKRGKRAK